ncbi:FMN-binding negative transcriptional regulator [Sphingomonas sp. BK235]|uniref:FMN-binding negative transcriptional regulator n=1 Tax=Sphingomonas sp. BK235 TaxID=2512131 RepID=UPI0010438FE5|nr:FMN-binding negative transcriptional regulator [Sphingomonas sp. BK235]
MSLFSPRRPGDLAKVIDQEVLGLVVTHDEKGFVSTPLPLLAEVDATGEVRALIGHFARANPHVDRATRTPRALVSFMGPHGYISPKMVSKSGWAPTWNYRLAQFDVEIEFADEVASGDTAIRRLVSFMEGAEATDWSVDRVGARYRDLVSRVIAFRAKVISSAGRFKLGQDEDEETFVEIVSAMRDSALAEVMLNQRGR